MPEVESQDAALDIGSAQRELTFCTHTACGSLSLQVACCRPAIFVVGRYLKLQRGLPQSPWFQGRERIGSTSVEEVIAAAVVPRFKAAGFKFHSAGREDADVRNAAARVVGHED